MGFSIHTRATVKGSGWYFNSPTTKFKDVYIKQEMFSPNTYIYFTYNGKYYYRQLAQGRYGDYFSFDHKTYYVLRE